MPPPIALAPSEITLSIRALYVYPLKAARGIALTSATVERRGIAHDRRWMVVDASARAITQRTHPAMARVSVTLGEDELLLETPGASPLRVPIGEPQGRRLNVEIFDDICESIAIGGGATAWFQSLLGEACELVYMPDSAIRAVDPRYASPGDITGFSDGFPILVTTEASLADLNSRLGAAVPMSRFRPNIVVGGAPAWDEDRWARISMGSAGISTSISMRVAKPCGRCVVTTVDQDTGESRGPEPLKTLASFRTRNGKAMFGQNLVPDAEGTIRVGDDVTVESFA